MSVAERGMAAVRDQAIMAGVLPGSRIMAMCESLPAVPTGGSGSAPSGVADLWWIPVGAGGHFVVHTSRLWERIRAIRQGRMPRRLFHAALEIHVPDSHLLVEMAPAWGAGSGSRGVVMTGPVGLRILGKSRLFRYEVRCWEDGILPDRAYAPEPPKRVPFPLESIVEIREQLRLVPIHVWGRDQQNAGDMWNSNSLIAWLLASVGSEASGMLPPARGVAPGWAAGIAAARV